MYWRYSKMYLMQGMHPTNVEERTMNVCMRVCVCACEISLMKFSVEDRSIFHLCGSNSVKDKSICKQLAAILLFKPKKKKTE